MYKFICYSLFLLFSTCLLNSVNGREIKNNEYRFHVAINRTIDGVTCSGVIVCPKFVLTSLKCVQSWEVSDLENILPANSVEVRAGSKYRSAGTKYEVDEIILPSEEEFINQVALLKLKKSISLSNLQRVTITDNGNLRAYYDILGWGRNGTGKAKAISSFALEKTECFERIGVYSTNFMCLDSTLSFDSIKCVSDFGSPVIYRNNQLVGLGAAPGGNCGSTEAFLKTAEYAQWINNFCQ